MWRPGREFISRAAGGLAACDQHGAWIVIAKLGRELAAMLPLAI